MKVIITGGCGFLGSNLAAHYLEQDAEVVIIDALLRLGSEQNQSWLRTLIKSPEQLHFYRADLAETSAVESIFKRHAPVDFVCHVGGQVAMTSSLTDPRRDFLTNALGTFNVLEAVRQYSPGALVAYSSTNKVYGDLEHLRYEETPSRFTVPAFPQGFDESLPLDFTTPYGCSKGAADQYVRDWHRVFGVKTVVFRHSSIYGGRQHSTFDQGWVGWFCQQAIQQKNARTAGHVLDPFTIAGTGKQVRDVLHAEDLVRLYHASYQNRENAAGQIFNIGGGMENSLSLLELFDMLAQLLRLDHSLSFIKTPRRQSDQDVFVADIGKVKRILGWTPLTNVHDGVERMLSWVGSLSQQ